MFLECRVSDLGAWYPAAIDSVAQVINRVNEDQEEEDKLDPPEALCGRVINLTV